MSSLKKIGAIFLIVCWLCSSFFINLVQLFLYITLRSINPSLFRKLNYYLTYFIWSQLVGTAQYWLNCELILYFPNKISEQRFCKDYSLCLMNHKYEIDWLYTYLATDFYKKLAASKSYTKKSLRFMPIIGWTFYFADFVFLERNWEKDNEIIKRSLNEIKKYEDIVTLLLFAEGTRFTKEKYEQSSKFAEERGLKVLKHHLTPRTKGFIHTVQNIKNHFNSIYNVQLEFITNDNEHHKPTLTSLLNGLPLVGHMYLERIEMKDLPDSSEDLNDYLFNLYEKKDDLTEEFIKNKKFDSEITIKVKPRLAPLINLLFWSFSVITFNLAFIYALYLYKCYTSLIIILFICSSISFACVALLLRSTRAVRGSTYGTSNKIKKN